MLAIETIFASEEALIRADCRHHRRGRRGRAMLATVALAVSPLTQSVFAQSPSTANVTVTEADVARAQRSQPLITEQDMERARKKYAMPSDAQLRRVPLPSTPDIGALPRPKTTVPLDLEAIAKGFDVNVGFEQAQGLAAGPKLLVFVSFAMPEPTLKRLAEQAGRANATLVLRGFVNGSLRDTVARVQGLIGAGRVPFQIDPQGFERFAIDKSPSFVLVRDGASTSSCASGQCFANEAFVKVAGDVSLDYALESMERAGPRFAGSAARYLDKIRSAR